jgi:hypothetical protein
MNASTATIQLSRSGSTFSYEHTVKDVEFYRAHWAAAGPEGTVFSANEEEKADFKLTAETPAGWENEVGDEKLSLSIEVLNVSKVKQQTTTS